MSFKKIICSGFIFVLITSYGFPQEPTRLSFGVIQKMKNRSKQEQDASLIVKGNPEQIKAYTEQMGGTFKYASGNIASIKIPASRISGLASQSFVKRIEDAPQLTLLNDKMIINNNVILAHMGVAPLTQGYDGTGVVMGLIDTGVDITHPDFKDINGKTRIKYLWDHILPAAANTPQPYGYGQEWSASQIDSGLCTHVDKMNGHGTHVTGIAAGNGLSVNNYKGVAPEADIIMVALDFNNSDWLSSVVDAIDYIFKKAQVLGKPCVINISAGTYYGSHDGTDLSAQLIDNMLLQENGRAIVCAAGNAGGAKIHLQYNLSSDTSFTWFSRSSGAIYLQMWGDTANLKNARFAIGADKKSPLSFVSNTSFQDIFYHLNTFRTDTLFDSGSRIGLIESYGELVDDKYSMEFQITPDSANYNWRLMTTGSGIFDLWSFDMLSDNLPDSTTFPDIADYKLPDTSQTIVSSYTCSPKVITVGSYVNRNSFSDVNGVIQTTPDIPGVHTYNSSEGPTRDGRLKPDITATGLWLLSTAVLADVPWYLANQAWKIAPGSRHILSSGTSMASPVVAGTAALYLQKNPNASYLEIKNAILSTAKQDQNTGSALPNNTWGYGKVDTYKALVGPVGLDDNSREEALLYNYPNPFRESTTIYYKMKNVDRNIKPEIGVFDMLGKKVLTLPLSETSGSITVSKGQLRSGVYSYNLSTDGKAVGAGRLVIF